MTYAYGIPALAVLFGAILLDEEITVWLVLGVALVVGGIVVAQRGLPRRGWVRIRVWRPAPSRGET